LCLYRYGKRVTLYTRRISIAKVEEEEEVERPERIS
jgi:hypothetical protein